MIYYSFNSYIYFNNLISTLLLFLSFILLTYISLDMPSRHLTSRSNQSMFWKKGSNRIAQVTSTHSLIIHQEAPAPAHAGFILVQKSRNTSQMQFLLSSPFRFHSISMQFRSNPFLPMHASMCVGAPYMVSF